MATSVSVHIKALNKFNMLSQNIPITKSPHSTAARKYSIIKGLNQVEYAVLKYSITKEPESTEYAILKFSIIKGLNQLLTPNIPQYGGQSQLLSQRITAPYFRGCA